LSIRALPNLRARSASVSCNVRNNFPQIILGLGSWNYWPAHVSMSLRASSAGVLSHRGVCSRAVLMPARGSISSSEVSLEGGRCYLSLAHGLNISESGGNDRFPGPKIGAVKLA
jgi:hypothetical protein